jgi:hypothetical protein
MKETFRMSSTVLLIRLLLPLVPILMYAPSTPRPLFTIALLEAVVALFVIMAWASNTIVLEGGRIQRIQFFLKHTSHTLSDIGRVRFSTEVGLFPSPRSVELVFSNGDVFTLASFQRSDIRHILERVRSIVPSAVEPSVDEYLGYDPSTNRRVPTPFRFQSGDKFYLTSAVVLAGLFLAWLLIQHFFII